MENQSSDSIGKIAAAMAKAQLEMATATKAAKNPFFKSNYADFNSIREAVMPALNNNGIAVFQIPINTIGTVAVKTTLAHESGEWISCIVTVTPSKPDPQATGSAITYARRYGLSAITSCGCEDDDGNAASQPTQQQRPAPSQKRVGPTEDQKAWLSEYCDRNNYKDNQAKKDLMAFYSFDMTMEPVKFEMVRQQMMADEDARASDAAQAQQNDFAKA